MWECCFAKEALNEQANANALFPLKRLLLAQVFVNRVQLIAGHPTFVESEAAEHLWVTKNEIGEYLGDAMGTYLKHVI